MERISRSLAPSTGEFTPESIIHRLSFFYEQVHHLHFNTTSFAEHGALNFWKDLVEYKDKIGELLLGYQAPKRFGVMPQITIGNPSPVEVLKQVISFAHTLDQWADKKGYMDLCNIAQELEGDAAKVMYLLTLK